MLQKINQKLKLILLNNLGCKIASVFLTIFLFLYINHKNESENMRSKFEIGEIVYYKNSEVLIGEIIGISETYWSHDKSTDVVYAIQLETGRIRKVQEKDIKPQ